MSGRIRRDIPVIPEPSLYAQLAAKLDHASQMRELEPEHSPKYIYYDAVIDTVLWAMGVAGIPKVRCAFCDEEFPKEDIYIHLAYRHDGWPDGEPVYHEVQA